MVGNTGFIQAKINILIARVVGERSGGKCSLTWVPAGLVSVRSNQMNTSQSNFVAAGLGVSRAPTDVL